jgi:hypothetical protein
MDINAMIAQRLAVPVQQVQPQGPVQPQVNYSMAQLNDMPLLQRQSMIDAMTAQQRQFANDSMTGGAGLTMGPRDFTDRRQLGGSALTETPLAVRQASINAAQGGPNLYSGMALTPEGQAYKKAFTPNQQQLAAMQARPDLAQRYVDATLAGRERVGQIGQQRRDRIAAQMAARARAMEGGGLKDALPMLGMMIPGAGALMGAYRMSQGQNRPGDYMKLAQMFL